MSNSIFYFIFLIQLHQCPDPMVPVLVVRVQITRDTVAHHITGHCATSFLRSTMSDTIYNNNILLNSTRSLFVRMFVLFNKDKHCIVVYVYTVKKTQVPISRIIIYYVLGRLYSGGCESAARAEFQGLI